MLFILALYHVNMYIRQFYFLIFLIILSILPLLCSCNLLTLLQQTNLPVCGTLKDFWFWFWFWQYIAVSTSAVLLVLCSLSSLSSLWGQRFLAKPPSADPLWTKYNPAPPCHPLCLPMPQPVCPVMGSLSHTILSLLNALNIPFAAFLSDQQPPPPPS